MFLKQKRISGDAAWSQKVVLSNSLAANPPPQGELLKRTKFRTTRKSSAILTIKRLRIHALTHHDHAWALRASTPIIKKHQVVM